MSKRFVLTRDSVLFHFTKGGLSRSSRFITRLMTVHNKADGGDQVTPRWVGLQGRMRFADLRTFRGTPARHELTSVPPTQRKAAAPRAARRAPSRPPPLGRAPAADAPRHPAPSGVGPLRLGRVPPHLQALAARPRRAGAEPRAAGAPRVGRGASVR
eukprot:7581203-Pyramimonas_sp.AAC.1